VGRALRTVTSENWYVLLERADQWWVQLGYGPNAGAPPLQYALERCEGGVERIFRTRPSGIDEAIRAFQAFGRGERSWIAGLVWTRVDL
jgi:hypothetical protein